MCGASGPAAYRPGWHGSHMQVQTVNKSYGGPLDVISQIYRKRGMRGFYQGEERLAGVCRHAAAASFLVTFSLP
jgi:hypothetical protein